MALSTMRVGAASRLAATRTQTMKVVARGSWRDAPTATVQASRSTSAANRVSPTRSVLPANWRQELESLRGGNGNGNGASAAAPAPAAPARAGSAKKPVTPSRSSLPSNWKQELESLRGSSPAPSAAAAAPARSTSASWRDAPASSSSSEARPTVPKKAVTPSRSSLPSNWKQELESLRGSSPAPASAPAPARSSSASWRDAPASSGSSSSADKAGTNPWTGKSKVEIKRTALPTDWRKGL